MCPIGLDFYSIDFLLSAQLCSKVNRLRVTLGPGRSIYVAGEEQWEIFVILIYLAVENENKPSNQYSENTSMHQFWENAKHHKLQYIIYAILMEIF